MRHGYGVYVKFRRYVNYMAGLQDASIYFIYLSIYLSIYIYICRVRDMQRMCIIDVHIYG